MGDLIWIKQPAGYTFKGCACIRDSWPTITALAVARGIIKQQIDVTQGSYSTSVNASALTHAGGGVLDIRQTSQAMDDLLEECGIASYVRLPADGFDLHAHILWIGCPHLHEQAADQVQDWMNRRNALRSNLPDRDQTRPSPIRDWRQGLAWAKQQLEDDMALSADDKAWLSNEIARGAQLAVNRALWEPLVPGRDDMGGSSVRNNLLHQSLTGSSVLGLLRELAARQGVDVDEEAIASGVVAGIAPQLIGALVAKLDGVTGIDAARLAREIVSELGAALQD